MYLNSNIWPNSAPLRDTVKPVFKTTWEIGTTGELRTDTSVPRPIYQIEMDLRNKAPWEFRTVLDSPYDVPNSQVPLYKLSQSEWNWHWPFMSLKSDVTAPHAHVFLLMFNRNIWPNSAPLQDTRLRNLSDIDFDLSRSLKVKSDGGNTRSKIHHIYSLQPQKQFSLHFTLRLLVFQIRLSVSP